MTDSRKIYFVSGPMHGQPVEFVDKGIIPASIELTYWPRGRYVWNAEHEQFEWDEEQRQRANDP